MVRFFKISMYLLIVFSTSCTKNTIADLFKNPGETITVERDVVEFNTIQINSIFNIIITQDTVEKVIITGGKNLTGSIKTDVINNVLNIEDKNGMSAYQGSNNRVTIEIFVKELNMIEVNAPCLLSTSNTIESTNFRMFKTKKSSAGVGLFVLMI